MGVASRLQKAETKVKKRYQMWHFYSSCFVFVCVGTLFLVSIDEQTAIHVDFFLYFSRKERKIKNYLNCKKNTKYKILKKTEKNKSKAKLSYSEIILYYIKDIQIYNIYK